MGFFNKLKGLFGSSSASEKAQEQEQKPQVTLSQDDLAGLEETLVRANFGVALSQDIVKQVLKASKKVGGESADQVLVKAIAHCLRKVVRVRELPEPGKADGVTVITLVGSNGSGKTTLSPKICQHYVQKGARPLLAVGDTFRAAAQDQSKIWAERAGVSVFSGKYKSDPASLAFEACAEARKLGLDVVLLDTAGRLHTSVDLMHQLEKIVRVLGKSHPAYPHELILTLDSTTGLHMLNQIEGYQKYVNLTGAILTKGDGFSKGGALMAALQKSPLDILGVSYGEDMDTFGPFKIEKFLERVVESTETELYQQ